MDTPIGTASPRPNGFGLATVAVVALTVLIAAWRIPRREETIPIVQAPKTITTPDELAQVLKDDALILHFDVDWSMTAVLSRPVVLRLKEMIERDAPRAGIVFRRIDFTEQSGDLQTAVRKWLSSQGADMPATSAGNGAVVLVKAGKVVKAIHCPARDGVEKLLAVTREAFPSHGFPRDGRTLTNPPHD